MTGLLLNPICHQYYYVYALPSIWSLIVYSDSRRRTGQKIEDDWIGTIMWSAALVAFLLLAQESPGLIEPIAETGFCTKALFGYGATIIAGLILWSTSALALLERLPGPTKRGPLPELQQNQLAESLR